MARRARSVAISSLPASLILTPHEQKHYRRYQRTQTPLSAHQQGALPSAHEYTSFQCWFQRRDSGYFSDEPLGGLAAYLQTRDENLAELCRHALHPSPQETKQNCCPMCTVDMHMKYMRLLKNHIKGSDCKIQQEESTSDDRVVNAWRAGRLSLVQIVSFLEKRAAEEDAWTKRNPDASIADAKTAEQALQMYNTAIEQDTLATSSEPSLGDNLSFDSSISSFSSSVSSRSSDSAKPRRTVCFDADTSFTLGRPQHYYHRLSPRYEAGKYAIAEPSNLAIESTANTVGASGTSALLSPIHDSGCVSFDDANDADEEDTSDEDHLPEQKHAPSHAAAIDRPNQEDDANDADEEGICKSNHSRPYAAAISRLHEGSQTPTPAHPADAMSDSESSDSDSDRDSDEDDDEDEEDESEFELEEDTSYIVFG
jgi:hypothetical protein